MNKELKSILIAGVVSATMLGAATVHAQTQRVAKSVAPAVANAPATAYRFATVIKTQSLRQPTSNANASLAEARIDTQLIHSPAYPDLEACKVANAAIAQLLGANVSIEAGSPRAATVATALATYKNTECLPSSGP